MKEKRKDIVALFIAFIALSLVLLTIWNMVMGMRDKETYEGKGYGQSVLVNGTNMVYDVKGAENETTIILLPGYGSVSPVLEFKDLSTKLSDKYRVITVEPFGYGFSDETVSERTAIHIASDIHVFASELGIDQYYVMGHSIAGVYSLVLANRYPEEILGFIGIDPSVPKMEDVNPFPVSVVTINKAEVYLSKGIQFLGITRAKNKISPLKDPIYTAEEIEYYTYLENERAGNKTVRDEINCLDESLKYIDKMKFPETVPVLNFVSSENAESMDGWEQLHHDVIRETERSEVVTVQGGHFLHKDNPDVLVDKIKEWIG